MTKAKSSRDKGDDVEDRVLKFLEPYFSTTAGSGSVFQDGDLRSVDFICEVKMRPTAGASVAGKDLTKLINRANMEGKDWLFVCQNYDKRLVAMTAITTYSYMYEEGLIARELRRQSPEQYERLYRRVKANKGRKNDKD